MGNQRADDDTRALSTLLLTAADVHVSLSRTRQTECYTQYFSDDEARG